MDSLSSPSNSIQFQDALEFLEEIPSEQEMVTPLMSPQTPRSPIASSYHPSTSSEGSAASPKSLSHSISPSTPRAPRIYTRIIRQSAPPPPNEGEGSSDPPTRIDNRPRDGLGELMGFETFEEAEGNLHTNAKQAGYHMMKAGGVKRFKGGALRKYRFRCASFGEYKESINAEDRKRNRTTIKTGCEYQSYVVRSAPDAPWNIFNSDEGHNHSPAKAETFYAYRKLTPTDLAYISMEESHERHPRDILADLRKADSDRHFDIRDIHNARSHLKKRRLGPLTPLQALMHELLAEDTKWF